MTATPDLSATREDRIPSLDGLRALGIVLVLISHLLDSGGAAPWLAPLWHVHPGFLGVRTFFVLSGYLITTLLIREATRTGTVNLRRFYLRRALRIMPAYYAFLLALGVATVLGAVAIPASSFVSAATYTSNYFATVYPVGHSWSLAVEEQFYILWPGALAALGLRRGFRLAAAVLVIGPVCRVAALQLGNAWPNNPTFSFECVADALATGCLLARYRDRLATLGWYRALSGKLGGAVWPAVVVVLAWTNVSHPMFAAAIGITLINFFIAGAVDWCMRNPAGLVGRVLNARPVVYVGVLSYAIYLVQQPFLQEGTRLSPIASLSLVAAAALLLHYLVELPGMAYRRRLESRRRLSVDRARSTTPKQLGVHHR